MKKLVSISLLLFVAASAYAQDPIPEKLLISSGQYIAPGARPLGLGGTYTGIADDYSAIWYNPAGLAQVKRIEVQGSLVRSRFANDASYFGNAREGATSAFRLNNIGMVFPIPVYQGAFSFAFGYNQVVDFDRRTRVQSPQQGQHPWDSFDELESGRLGIWSLAMAVDVSQNLALGGGINYWNGGDEYTLTENFTNNGSQGRSETTLNTDLGGWNLGLGGIFRAGRYARIGMMLQSPFSMSIKEDWNIDGDTGYNNYRITYPAVFRVGASLAPGRWLIASDIEYRDWTAMQFRSETPFIGVSRAEANQEIKDAYKGTTRISLGGEYLFPGYGLRARAGFSVEPNNFKALGEDADKGVLSLGVGILIDRSVMLDMTIRATKYTESYTPGLTEDIRSSTALFTISYRM